MDVSNYLGMVFDTSTEREARVIMKGYVDELLNWFRGSGTAKRKWERGEDVRKTFLKTVAKLLYLAKRARLMGVLDLAN